MDEEKVVRLLESFLVRLQNAEISAGAVDALMARNLVLEVVVAGLMQALMKSGAVAKDDLRMTLATVAGQFPADKKNDPGFIAVDALLRSLDTQLQNHAEKAFPFRPKSRATLQ